MKELIYDSLANQDYKENSSDLFDPTIKTDTPYSGVDLLIIQDVVDQMKLAKGSKIDDDDVKWSLAMRELATDIGDEKVVFRLDEQGLLFTEIVDN